MYHWHVYSGMETRSRKQAMADLRNTAYHEAGHALVSLLTPGKRTLCVLFVSVKVHGANASFLLPSVTITGILRYNLVFLCGRMYDI